ncbi:MAG: hypothetical protein WAZ36_07935 [Sediminibacterium sp.]
MKIQAHKKVITECIESGATRNFDPKKHFEKLKASRRKNGTSLLNYYRLKLNF